MYAIVADFTSPTGQQNCLNIVQSNVQLDCQHHKVAGITVNGTSNVAIINCSIQNDAFVPLSINQSQHVTVTNSTIASGVINAGGFVTVSVLKASYTTLSNDTFSSPSGHAAPTVVALVGGSHNQVLQSGINGGWNGSPSTIACSCPGSGVDDGIVVQQGETDDVVQGNTISNVYDMGIEGCGSVVNTTFSDNVIANAGRAGIGTVFSSAWQGNIVSNNRISGTRTMMLVAYSAGGCGITPGVFQNNTITGNVFQNPIFVGTALHAAEIDLSGIGSAGANILRGNDFGVAVPGPDVVPLSAFDDTSGNACAQGGTLRCAAIPSLANFLRPR